MKKIVFSGFIIIFCTISLTGDGLLRFSIAEGSSSGKYIPLITEIYRTMGYNIEILPLPAERGLKEADEGRLDGDLARSSNSLDGYSHLVFTKEPLGFLTLHPWIVRGSNISITSPEDMRNYSIGYVRGLKMAESYCCDHHFTCFCADSISTLANMVRMGRIDIALSACPSMNKELNNWAVKLPLVLDSLKIFHVLHSAHSDLVAPFDRILIEMNSAENINSSSLPPRE
ncbi:MAG: hypothetical protein JXR86_02680 [Spirochaetales bacterium]|nr:hypothetical protein [Spirochaetales bacterium]